MNPAGAESVLVLDFGGRYAQMVARRIRESGVYAELKPAATPIGEIREGQPRALVLAGGPPSIHEEGAPRLAGELLDLGLPLLAVGYGMQAMVAALGGQVEAIDPGESGRTGLSVTGGGGALLGGLPGDQTCWMDHADAVTAAPDGFLVTASSPESPVAAVEDTERQLFGVQFHPEMVQTSFGTEIIQRFLRDVAGCGQDWTPASIVADQIAAIREQVGDGRAVCGLSGGVDSAVSARLVYEAIGDRLTCVFVDHGLMRADEATQVVEDFREFGIPLVHVDAEQRFLSRLAGVTDPETKRKIIGDEFIRVFEEEAARIEDVGFLVQGTIYSDVVESADSKGTVTVKSHHNVGGLPDDLTFELVEPLRSLLKDEVRAVGTELGLPDRMVWRQPFPGPGLGIRIVGGEVNRERLDILRAADRILHEEIGAANLYRDLWQFFCVMPVIRSVGVQNDERTYAYPIVIRAVNSTDAMTADWARIPYEVLEKISTRIVAEVDGINRVAFDITSKPPGTIEWE